ncbi:Protein FAM50A [Heterocephalus glaber]|uniref:Protein FAM50A n=1 Tax=Heterocephalus glaber TaxID=10181 RepID=G5BFL0_HETGA|nr:Protein FAM50A [Heterocephalus glaber]
MAQYKGAASEAGRAMHLMKKREKQREQMEQMKQRIAEENIMKSNIDKKFSAHYDAVEAELKSSTVGLVTLNDMKAKQEALVKEREKQLAKKEQSKELQLKLEKLREKERKKEAKRKISSLSFTLEEEEEGGEEEEVAIDEEELERAEVTTKKRKLGKNPDVDTSFLPDRDREEEENRLREELRQEWEAKQEKIKSEEIEITFSYWDGSGHRRTVKVGAVELPGSWATMQQFLQKALEILRKDFSELRSAGVEQLMYIKEDLIIPHHHSFYDFIVTKARPLFNFDVHDDVRLLSDATVEKDESHAGKVVLRSWYEKNKHIFPASRWEPYDPEKKWDKYTVSTEGPDPVSLGGGVASYVCPQGLVPGAVLTAFFFNPKEMRESAPEAPQHEKVCFIKSVFIEIKLTCCGFLHFSQTAVSSVYPFTVPCNCHLCPLRTQAHVAVMPHMGSPWSPPVTSCPCGLASMGPVRYSREEVIGMASPHMVPKAIPPS